jgi:hypothetical protein
MSSSKKIGFLVAAVVAMLLVYLVFRQDEKATQLQEVTPVHESSRIGNKKSNNRPSDVSDVRVKSKIDSINKKISKHNKISKTDRAKLLAKILKNIEQAQRSKSKIPATTKSSSQVDPTTEPGLSKEYISEQMKEIIPLIEECYEMALVENPNLSGKISVQFTIVADEEYGGLIETSELINDELGHNRGTLSECLRETMYALRMKAPQGGGRVTVKYPFIFNVVNYESDTD